MVMYLVTASISQAWSPLFRERGAQWTGRAAHAGAVFICGLSLLLMRVAIFGSLIAEDVVSHFLDKRYSSAGRLIPWIIAGYLFHALYSVFRRFTLSQVRRVGFLWVVRSVALVANLSLDLL